MKRFALVATLFVGFAAISVADDAEKASKELNGVYKVKSMTKNGMPAPEEVINVIKSFTIKDGTMVSAKERRDEKFNFVIDATQKPAHIDMTPTTGPEKDMVMKGIYKLEKGILTLCLKQGDERPKDFDAKGDKIATIVMEKNVEKK